jgi:hypothetical protein
MIFFVKNILERCKFLFVSFTDGKVTELGEDFVDSELCSVKISGFKYTVYTQIIHSALAGGKDGNVHWFAFDTESKKVKKVDDFKTHFDQNGVI